MRLFILVGLLGSLLAGPVLAQTDTMLRTNGNEVRGRVLTISPACIRYLAAAGTGTPAAPDTLQMPADSVFLIRYANGTREVLHPQTTAPASLDVADEPLRGLSSAQRYQRGQADARAQYRGGGAFAGTLGTTVLLGPLMGPALGLVSTVIISSSAVPQRKLAAPGPVLLRDNVYVSGYREQAKHTRRSRAWSGYGVGMGIDALLVLLLLGMAH